MKKQTSREIKFRAWHEDNNKMVYFDNNKAKDDMHQARYMVGLMAGDFGDVLMQYVGIKDKNGVDMWEGDIVTFDVMEGRKNEKPKFNQIGVVQLSIFNGVSIGSWGSHHHNYKVIGNRFENPEIIKRIELASLRHMTFEETEDFTS